MTFVDITKQYLRTFQVNVTEARKGGAISLEMATRPIVHSYLCELLNLCRPSGTEISILHDIQYTKENRPDWRVEDSSTFGVFCFGDHKNTNFETGFSLSKSERTQIQRYLDLGRPVFVFDGIEFLFFTDRIDNFNRYSLIQKPVRENENWSKNQIDNSIESAFRNLLNNPGFRKWTETELIELLALRAKQISNELYLLLQAPTGSGVSDSEENLMLALHQLKGTIEKHHDPSLRDDKSCADFIAQVLTFGLFYAHTHFNDDLTDANSRGEKIKQFWSTGSLSEHAIALRPFSTIIDILSSSLKMESDNFLSNFYHDVGGLLAHAEYMGAEVGPQDFHTLFEKFFEKFDRETKFNRGAFYTPKNLTEWAVRMSDELSKKYFGNSIAIIADKIIDPCCGTGGFLEAAYSQLAVGASRFPKLVGFEVLPAPYALAHYRLSQIVDKMADADLYIMLTDTLSDRLMSSVELGEDGFSNELRDAAAFSASPIRLIIGNPPSALPPKNPPKRDRISGLLEDFRPPQTERTARQNTQKALNNEAYLFLRWCCERIQSSTRGMIALVLPGSFSDSPSFKYIRKWMLEIFDTIYILEIDNDLRTGSNSDSLFSVQQGRLMVFAILKGKLDAQNGSAYPNEKFPKKVFHLDIRARSLGDKRLFLNSPIELDKFVPIDCLIQNFEFSPLKKYDTDLWNQGWPLHGNETNDGIFFQKCSGVKLSPSSVLFHTQKPILLRRSLAIGDSGSDIAKLTGDWFAGQQRPPNKKKFTSDFCTAIKKAAGAEHVAPYLFRPFLNGWVINNEEVFNALKEAPGGGTRSRPEIRSAIAAGACGIAIAPSPKDIGSTMNRFACFVWEMPDNDIAARGNGMIYVDLFPHTKNSTPENNVSSKALELFSFSISPSRFLLYYIYAILSSPAYLEKFNLVLFTKSDAKNPPRIPFAKSLDARKKIAEAGRRIAECEKFDKGLVPQSNICGTWPDKFRDFELAAFTHDTEKECLILLDEKGEQVEVRGVTAGVVNLVIAGHSIVEKWI